MKKDLVTQVLKRLAKQSSCQQVASQLGLTRQQVAAVKAHRTMESYDADPSKMSDADRMKIVALVKEGLTSKQIRPKMRNRYNHQQIAAIKAWVTMGKY